MEIINVQNKHIYPSFILPNTTLGLAEIDAVRASRDEREVGDFNSNVRSQIAYNTESIVLSTVRTNGILLAQVTPRGGLIAGTSSIMKLKGDNWQEATYLKDDGLHINWPEIYHHDHWTHSHDFTAKDKDLDEGDNRQKKKKKSIDQLYDIFENAKQYNLLNKKDLDLRLEALQNIFSSNTTLYIHANTVNGIKEAIMFSKHYNIKKMVIVGGSESWR
ncbi:MAG: amidohydrolase, partial [Flavobacteriales bacterium]|nr:amidohydrolase [Flavobacteriales bacterium]